MNTLTIATIVMVFKIVTSFIVAYAFVFLRFPVTAGRMMGRMRVVIIRQWGVFSNLATSKRAAGTERICCRSRKIPIASLSWGSWRSGSWKRGSTMKIKKGTLFTYLLLLLLVAVMLYPILFAVANSFRLRR